MKVHYGSLVGGVVLGVVLLWAYQKYATPKTIS